MNYETSENEIVKSKRKVRRKLTDTFPMLSVLTVLLIIVGQMAGSLLRLIPLLRSSDVAVTALMYLEFIGIWVVALLYFRITKKNRPILRTLWREPSGNRGKLFALGLLLGFGMNGICILAAALNDDIHLHFYDWNPAVLVILFIAVFIQSSAEEMLCRGFLYQRLLRSYKKPWVAITGSSALFALMHLGNDGVTVVSLINIFAVGVLFALMVYDLDSMWCAMAMHTAWNYTQNILFGLPNSGSVAPYSLFRLDAATASDSVFYNCGFGIEGTLFADLVLIAACLVLYVMFRKKEVHPLDIWVGAAQ